MSTRFQDHFSGHAADYARYRPTYPRALFAWLAQAAPGRALAWDCATGSGQAAVALVDFFDGVVATDASERQLAAAEAHPRVSYRLEPAEAATLEDASCDLVTVAQALHWLDFEAFYSEVRRVARPGAILGAWAYERMRVSPEIDAVLDHLLDRTLGGYWPVERAHVEAAYASVPFPFTRVPEPTIAMELDWSADQTLAYLRTWSAVQRFRTDRGFDPVDRVETDLVGLWGEGRLRVHWPLVLRFGTVE